MIASVYKGTTRSERETVKTDYLTEQYLLQTEQQTDFQERARELLYRSTHPEGKTQGASGSSDSFLQTLLPYIGEDLEILKLYVASHISNCTAAGHKAGLPLHVAEALKKEAFVKIAKACSVEELGSISSNLLRKMSEKSHAYNIGTYSYNVQRAVEYIHIQLFQPLSASDVAAHLNLERTSLSRQFHRETGRTLTEYIHGAKMEEAEKLIVSHQYSLVEIADMLGYSSYRYFAKVYKKYRHCLPTETQRAFDDSFYPDKKRATE